MKKLSALKTLKIWVTLLRKKLINMHCAESCKHRPIHGDVDDVKPKFHYIYPVENLL